MSDVWMCWFRETNSVVEEWRMNVQCCLRGMRDKAKTSKLLQGNERKDLSLDRYMRVFTEWRLSKQHRQCPINVKGSIMTWLCACSGRSQMRLLGNLGFVSLASSNSFKGQVVYHLSLKDAEENRKLGVLSVI